MNKKHLGIALIIIGIFTFFFFNKDKTISLLNSGPTPTVLKYPESWKKVDSTAILKLEKSVTSGLKPEIVLIKSQKPEGVDPKNYLSQLIAGAVSAIPSLKITQNQDNELIGYYYNQKNKVLTYQKVYFKENDVYTITASYDQENDLTEIKSIFAQIASEYLPN